MPCPKCGSHNLWDDMMWWGCIDCHFMTDTIRNQISDKDRWNHFPEKKEKDKK